MVDIVNEFTLRALSLRCFIRSRPQKDYLNGGLKHQLGILVQEGSSDCIFDRSLTGEPR